MTKRISKLTLFSVAFTALAILLSIGTYTLWGPKLTSKSIQTAESPSHTTQTQAPRTLPKSFNAQHYELPNGLQIIVLPNTRTPVVTHMVWYKVGAADDPIGQSGLAHFLEHLMFKGTQKHPAGTFSKTVRALGGKDNAFTSHDYTAYYQSIAKEHLSTVMAMEADRMRGLTPPEQHITSERAVVIEERQQRTDSNILRRLYEHANAAHFIHHPYGRPIIGWRHEIETLNWDKAHAFYRRFYGPNNAIVIVTGDVTGPEVLSMAQSAYGAIARIRKPQRTWTQRPPLAGETSLTLSDGAIQQPQITLIFTAPSYAQDKRTAMALEILQELLSGGPAAPLYQDIVVKQGLATAVSMHYDGTALSHARLSINAYLSPGTQPEALKAGILNTLARIAKTGLTDEERTAAIQTLQDSFIFARDSLNGPAMLIGRALTSGIALQDIEYWTHDLETLTAHEIQNAAHRYLSTPVNMTTAIATQKNAPHKKTQP